MERSKQSCNCPWEEIEEFRSLIEFRQFERQLNEKLQREEIAEVSVEQRYADSSMFNERWFKFGDGDVWRLVSPDPPFKGVFLKI